MSDQQFVRTSLVIPVSKMTEAREWYERVLGFETTYLHNDPVEDPEGNYAQLRRDDAAFALILDEPPRDHPAV